MKFSLVPFGEISAVIPVIWPYLQESASWTRGRSTVDDILREVFTGRYLLWTIYDDTRFYGHMIVEIKEYPRMKMLAIQHCAAAPWTMEKVEGNCMDTIEAFARDAGCAGVEWVGRPGWGKVARKFGYTTRGAYHKFFEVAE